jgi:hypothetical protein
MMLRRVYYNTQFQQAFLKHYEISNPEEKLIFIDGKQRLDIKSSWLDQLSKIRHIVRPEPKRQLELIRFLSRCTDYEH